MKWMHGLIVPAAALLAGAAIQTDAVAAPAKITVDKSATTIIGTIDGTPGSVSVDIGAAEPAAIEIQKPKRRGGSPLRADPASESDTPLAPGVGAPTSSGKKAKSNPEVNLSFEGLNHRQQRLASGGNQFSGEPADQGLCVGNGYILESVNSAIRIYDAATGAPVTPAVSLNAFYGFAPAINRTTRVFGPFSFDISCHYDPASNRWFHLAVDLDQNPATGAFTGLNFLDLAVSASGDPTGAWTIYRIPGMNDGTAGTPDHGCPGGPCFADFPHIGVDANGVYISTNEFPLFANGFIGAQVYAISKAALVAASPSIDVLLFNTGDAALNSKPGEPGFTLWPALSAGTEFSPAQNGSNFFVSSNAVFTNDGVSNEMIVWALSNTASLNSANPSLRLTSKILASHQYAVPPASVQKAGDIPNGNFTFGYFGPPGPIDTSDSRVLDARFANGKLWAVLGTAAEVGNEQRAGVSWFVFNPKVNSTGVSATIVKQGILALAGESLAYPTVGVTSSGRGVIGFTRVGENLHPSVGYASIDAVAGVGAVHMIKQGNAPQDGFTEYGARPRWGDYGAAAVDGANVYLAGQYIEQGPCTVAQFLATGGSCFGTRTQLANWSTRVTKLTP